MRRAARWADGEVDGCSQGPCKVVDEHTAIVFDARFFESYVFSHEAGDTESANGFHFRVVGGLKRSVEVVGGVCVGFAHEVANGLLGATLE